jgi:thioredoxin-like negative regulator of GroEL
MRVRVLIWLTAIVSSMLGAIVVYLALSVPNDLQADAMLKTARQDLAAGKSQEARASLSKIVQQYPRTDAAAAATVALVSIADSERAKLQQSLEAVAFTNRQHATKIAGLEKTVAELKSAPPKVVTVTAPPKPAPKVTKKAPAKKKPTPKRPTRRRR